VRLAPSPLPVRISSDTIVVELMTDIILQNLLNGISFGTILFLLASGLSISLGLMGILNLAHGAIYMVGGYVGWLLAVRGGLNFWFSVLIAGLTTGLLGLIIERGFLRHLYKKRNEQVLLTFGLIYILTNLSIWIWGAEPRGSFTAPFLSGSFSLLGWQYPKARISIIIIGVVLVIVLWWLQDKTRLGAMVRAGMENKEIATGLGINMGLVSTSVFFLASFLAGFAGVVGAQLLGVYPDLSLDVLLLALVVVVIGGMGSVKGTLLGSVIIGLIDSFGVALFPQLAMFTIYLAMIIILLARPAGLLGKKV
jgi:branched-chain amino acid transport system permease protein